MEEKEYYNKEPVFYCKNCLSLRIRSVQSIKDSEFCDKCSSTDIATTNIENWRAMYMKRYGFDYLENFNNNGRE